MSPDSALHELFSGNVRFRTGRPNARSYDPRILVEIAHKQEPIAAVVACSDSRVSPTIILDQPLGSLFECRVPGNVASESARWVTDMAVTVFRVPLVLVMGHTGCLAVTSVLESKPSPMAGALKMEIQGAIYRARSKRARSKPQSDPLITAIEENARQTAENLEAACESLRNACVKGECRCVASVYEMESGSLRLLED